MIDRFCRNVDQYIRTSTPSPPHGGLCSVDCISPASTPACIPVWHLKGARDYWVSVVRAPRYGKNVGREGVGKGG